MLLDSLLEPGQVVRVVEGDVVLPGPVELILDHGDDSPYLVSHGHQFGLVDVLLEVELELQLHDDGVDELLVDFGHDQERVLLDAQVQG